MYSNVKRYSRSTVRVQRGVQSGYTQGTVGVQSGYSGGTVRVQQGYSQDTAEVQWGIVGTSRGTVVLVVYGGVCGGGVGNNDPMIVRRLKSVRRYRHIIRRVRNHTSYEP